MATRVHCSTVKFTAVPSEALQTFKIITIMRNRWVSWAAVSSLPQAKKISNQQQLDINRQHAEKHGGEVVRELVVPGESRSIVLLETAAERIKASLRKADTAWLDGTLDDDRYRTQVDRLKAQLATTETEAERLQRAIADAGSREVRRERLLSVAAMGASILDGDETAANAWLRQVLRIVVHSGSEVEAHWL